MGRLCVYVDFTRVFDVCGEKCDGLYTFIRFHRGFCMILIKKSSISMFIRYHRGFRCVLTRFPTIFLHFSCADAFRRGNRLRPESWPLRSFPWECSHRGVYGRTQGFSRYFQGVVAIVLANFLRRCVW